LPAADVEVDAVGSLGHARLQIEIGASAAIAEKRVDFAPVSVHELDPEDVVFGHRADDISRCGPPRAAVD
jgi:hypothetical protein